MCMQYDNSAYTTSTVSSLSENFGGEEADCLRGESECSSLTPSEF
jgi:hypothetical protein